MSLAGPRPHPRWLAATAVSYVLLHHLGLLPQGLGAGPEGTRWADWLDLAVPWLVLAPAALTLAADRPPPATWVLFGAGVVAYASGHGIHLAANSVANAAPGRTAHLWDEVVGHAVWYLGVALVLAALAATMTGRPRPHPVGHLLAVGAGLTWASNALGVGTVPPALLPVLLPALVVAVLAAGFGWHHRDGLGVVLLVGYLPAVGVLGVEVARTVGGGS